MTSTTLPGNYESLSGNSPAGSIWRGQRRQIIDDGAATRTLLAKESGALCIFSRAAGTVYTLPSPEIGMEFEFMTSVSVTSNANKTITAKTTEFLIGGIMSANLTVAASGDFFVANGTTHVAISENGSDTGGLVGGRYRVVALNTTQWLITGVNCGSGTNADPFATS